MEPRGGSQPCHGSILPALYPKTREWHREKPGSESQSRGVGLAVPRAERSSQGSQAGRQHTGVQGVGADLYFDRTKLPHPIGHLRRLGEELTCSTATEGKDRGQ